MMKRMMIGALMLSLLVSGGGFAYVPSFEAGIVGETTMTEGTYYYEEITFLSGEPILLKGTATLPEIPEDDDDFRLTYDYELFNEEAGAQINRTVSLRVVRDRRDYDQTTTKVELAGIDEDITIDGTEYNLASYRYDQTKLTDNTPAVDYFNGNFYLKRVYYLNGDFADNEGRVDYEITSDTFVGYDHYWGRSETQILNHTLTVSETEDPYEVQAQVKMSSLDKTRFRYTRTDPQNISFRGNYIMTEHQENVMSYRASTPSEDERYDRQTVEKSYFRELVTDSRSLVTPKLKDVGGHWAEEPIVLLTSLEILEASETYFSPDTPITRLEFGKALANAITSIEPATRAEIIRRARPGNEKLFYDIDSDHADYNHIAFLKERGIMAGETGFFKPDRTVTREEVLAILINTLGLENLAPMPPYATMYTDDSQVAAWAKDQVYVAGEIGLVSGYADGSIRPKSEMTRAEAAALLVKFIDHIRDTITYDYRESILNVR